MLASKSILLPKLRHLVRDGFAIRLSLRYVAATTLIVGLAVAGKYASHTAARQGRFDRQAQSMACGQRSLCQRIVRAALHVQSSAPGPERFQAASELSQLAHEWDQSHNALRYGNAAAGLPDAASRAVESMFAEMHPQCVGLDQAAHELVNLAHHSPETMAEAGHSIERLIARILRHERGVAEGMDRLVDQLERESHDRAGRAEFWQGAVLTLLVAAVVLQGLLVLAPLVQRLRRAQRHLALVQAELAAARMALDQSGRPPVRRLPQRSREPSQAPRREPLPAVA
jgi:hypothetical protein